MPILGTPVVHLDLKDFIELAKEVKIGKSSLLDRLVKLREDHKIIVVVSGMLMFEVFGIKDPRQRSDIGEVMEKLSKTFVLRPHDEVQHMEITNAVADHFGVGGRRFDMASDVYGVGYMEAIGHVKLSPPASAAEDPELYAEIEALCYKEMLKDDILTRTFAAMQAPKIQAGGKEHKEILDAVEFTRRKWSGKSFHEHEENSILELADSVVKQFDPIATKLNVLVNGLHPLCPEHFRSREFLSSLPSVNAWDRLFLYLLHKDKTKTFDVNHLYDIGQLSVAVPYCDVVVCDKEMARVIDQSHLARQYNTQVFPNLSVCITYLERL